MLVEFAEGLTGSAGTTEDVTVIENELDEATIVNMRVDLQPSTPPLPNPGIDAGRRPQTQASGGGFACVAAAGILYIPRSSRGGHRSLCGSVWIKCILRVGNNAMLN